MKMLITVLLILLAAAAQGQAPYLGGEGGGYARTSLALESPAATFEAGLARMEDGGPPWYELQVKGLETTCNVVVTDVAGRRIVELRVEGPGEARLRIPTEGWASGLYLLKVSANGETRVLKLRHAEGGER